MKHRFCNCRRRLQLSETSNVESRSLQYKKYRRRFLFELLESRWLLAQSPYPHEFFGLDVSEGEGNNPPVLSPIGNQSIFDARQGTKIGLEAFDLDNEPLSFSAISQSYEYYLDQAYAFRFAGGNEYFNWLGQQEKWLAGHASWYYILPNGNLYRWNGNHSNDEWIDTLPTSDYSNTSLLYDALPNNAPARIELRNDILSVDPTRGFEGRFAITVTVTDGQLSDSETFIIHVLGTAFDLIPPSIVHVEPPKNALISDSVFSLDVTFSEAVQFIDVTDLEVHGSAALAAVKQAPVAITPNLWRFEIANLRNGALSVSLGNDIHDIEDLDENSLEPIVWEYQVSIHSLPSAPILEPIPNQSLSNGALQRTIELRAYDANFDALTFSASTTSIETHLDSLYHFEGGNEYYNYSGFHEKWIYGSTHWYYLLPTGELFLSNNYDARPNTDLLIERLPVADYEDLSRLHSPEIGASPGEVNLMDRRLTINPDDAFVGRFVVRANVSDGSYSDTTFFYVDVLGQAENAQPPSVISLTPPNGSTSQGIWTYVDVEFSEPVLGLDATDLELDGAGALSAIVGTPQRITGNQWRFPVNELTHGSIHATLGGDSYDIVDGDGNSLVPVTWSFSVTTNGLLFQFPPTSISFTSADLVLNFDSPDRFLKSSSHDNVVVVGGGNVSHAEVRTRGDVARFDATGYLQFDVEDRPSLNYDWTLFARVKDPKQTGDWNTLFRGAIDQPLTLHPQSRELGYVDVDGGRGFVGTGYIATVLDNGGWHSLAVTRSGTRIDYYVDGLKVGQVMDASADELAYVGGGFGQTFSDYLDDFRYFDRAIADERAKAILDLHLDNETIVPFASGVDETLGIVSGIDVDLGDRLQFTLTRDASGLFEIDSSTGVLKIADLRRFKTEPLQTYTLSVQAMDRLGFTRERNFNIQTILRDAHITGDGNGVDVLYRNDASMLGGVGFALGLMNDAFAFDGIDDHVRLRRSAWDPNGTNSYSFWFRSPTTLGQLQSVSRNIIALDGTSTRGWSLFLQSNGKLGFRLETDSFSRMETDISDVLVGPWHFVSLAFLDSGNVRIRLDNRWVRDIDYSGSMGGTAHSFVRFGSDTAWAAPFVGRIDDIRFSERIPSDTELEAIYRKPEPRIGNIILEPSVPSTAYLADENLELLSPNYYLVDTTASYTIRASLDGTHTPAFSSAGIVPLTIDRQPLDWIQYDGLNYPTETVLAQPVKSGDLQIHVADASHWYNGTDATQRVVEFLVTASSIGELPSGVAAPITMLDAYAAGGIVGNTIALQTQYFGQTIPAGTKVRNRTPGIPVQYSLADAFPELRFPTQKSANLSGVAAVGQTAHAQFKPGTDYIVGFAASNHELAWSDFQIESENTLSVLENQSFGRSIGRLQLLQDAVYVYATHDLKHAVFVSPQGEIFLAQTFDYEKQPYYNFQIEAVAVNGVRSIRNIRIEVKDVNEPIDHLDAILFPNENLALGSPVGLFRALDPDRRDRFAYAIAPELSSPNVQAYFSVDTSTGRLIRTGNEAIPAGDYQIAVRATDLAGHTAVNGFTVTKSTTLPGIEGGSRKEFWATSTSIVEGNSAVVWLHREVATTQIDVEYAAIGINATEALETGHGGDFLRNVGILHFEQGVFDQRVDISTLYDLENEGTETVVVDFQIDESLIARSAVRIDNSPRPSLSLIGLSSASGADPMEGDTVTMEFEYSNRNDGPRAFADNVSFPWNTHDWSAGSSDYQSQLQTVHLPAVGVHRFTTQVATHADWLQEDTESFFVEVTTPWGTIEQHPIFLKDATDRRLGISFEMLDRIGTGSSSDRWTVEEGSLLRFRIKLDEPTEEPITLFLSSLHGTTDTADFTSLGLSVNFMPKESEKDFSILVLRDFKYELNEHFYLALETPWHEVKEVDVEIRDENLPMVTVNAAIATGGSNAVFDVELSQALPYPVTFNYQTRVRLEGGGLGSIGLPSGTLSFSAGQTLQQISIPTHPLPSSNDPYPGVVEFYVDVVAPWDREFAIGQVLYPGGFQNSGNVESSDQAFQFELIDLYRDEFGISDFPGYLAGTVPRTGSDIPVFELTRPVAHGYLKFYPTGDFKYRPYPGYVGLDSFWFKATSPSVTPEFRIDIDLTNGSTTTDEEWFVASGARSTIIPSVGMNDLVIGSRSTVIEFGSLVPAPVAQRYTTTDFLRRPSLTSPYHYFGDLASNYAGRYQTPSIYALNWPEYFVDRHRLFDQLAGANDEADIAILNGELNFSPQYSGRLQLDAPYVYGDVPGMEFKYVVSTSPQLGTFEGSLRLVPETNSIAPPIAFSGSFGSGGPVWRNSTDQLLGNVFLGTSNVYQSSGSDTWRDLAGRALIASEASEWEALRIYSNQAVPVELIQSPPLPGDSVRGGHYKVQPDGRILYSPPEDFVGTDWIAYVVRPDDGRMGIVGDNFCPSGTPHCLDEFVGGMIQVTVRDMPSATPDSRANIESQSTLTIWTHDPVGVDSYSGPNGGIVVWNDHNTASTDLVVDGLHWMSNDIGISGRTELHAFASGQFIAQTSPWGYALRVPVGFIGDKSLSYVLTEDGKELTFPVPVNISVHGPTYNVSPPVFVSVPVTTGFSGMAYEYTAHAIEPNGKTVTYSLGNHPDGMTIDPTSGRISWRIQQYLDASPTIPVSVIATDTENEQAEQSFIIRVVSHNQPPLFTTIPEVDAEVGQIYRYPFAAFDQDADRLSFRLVSSPGWQLQDDLNGSGTLTRIVGQSDLVVSPAFQLEVSDGINAPVIQTATLVVQPLKANRPPVITSKPVIRFEQAGSGLKPLGDVRETISQQNRLQLHLQQNQTANFRIELRLSSGPPKVDIMLLLDDTGSFEHQNRQLAEGFLELVEQLRQLRPNTDFGFGVSRFDDFIVQYPGNRSNEEIGSAFTLNQPIISMDYSRFQQVMLSTLDRTSRGTGGNDSEEAFLEALYQLASGTGLDANNNFSTTDNGVSGSFTGQLAPSNQDIARTIHNHQFEFDPSLHPSFRLLRISDQPILPLNQPVRGTVDQSMTATAFRYEGQANELLTLTNNLGWIDGARYNLNGLEQDAGQRILSVYSPDGNLIRPLQNDGNIKQYLLPSAGQYAIVVDQEPVGAPRYGSNADSIRFNEAENSSAFRNPFAFELVASSSVSIPNNAFAGATEARIDSVVSAGSMDAGETRLYRLEMPQASTPILRVLEGVVDWEFLSETGSLIRFGSENEQIITPTQYRSDAQALSVALERYSSAGNGAIPAGTYYLRLRSSLPQSQVTFRLMIPQLASETIQIGQIVQRNFTPDASYYFGSFQGIAGQEVEIEFNASNVSSRFWLIAPDGTRIADVDSYQSNAAPFRRILPFSGVYTIAASIGTLNADSEIGFSMATRLVKQHASPVYERNAIRLNVAYEPRVTDMASFRYDVEVNASEQLYFDGLNADARVRVDYFKSDGSMLFSLLNSEMNRMMPQSNYTDAQYFQLEPMDLVAGVSTDRLGGGGFRPGSLPIIVAATDNGSRYGLDFDDNGCAITVTRGIEGTTGDLRTIVGNSFITAESASCHVDDPLYQFVDGNPVVPSSFAIATVQDALDALIAKGALVVGVGTSPVVDGDGLRQTPASMLEELARLTGAVNATSTILPNNVSGDGIAPGEPLYISMQGSDPTSSISLAIQSAMQALSFDIDVVVLAEPDIATVTSPNRITVTPAQSGFADLQLTGDGGAHSFYLEFLRHGTGVVLGRIPIGINYDYLYDVNAVDPDNDTVSFRLVGETHGAQINSNTGEILWSPPAHGSYLFTVEASDGRGGIATDRWTVDVDVLNSQNRAPTIQPITDQSVEVNRPYQLTVDASDPDGNALRYQLMGSVAHPIPAGMNITPAGIIQWNPNALQVGQYVITVSVDDGRGGQASQSFNIRVLPGQSLENHKPQFTSTPVSLAVIHQAYRYQVSGIDLDGDSLQFRLIQGPRNMVLDSSNNVIAWHPTSSDLGEHAVSVLLSDGQGGTVSQTFNLRVSTPNEAPIFRSTPVLFAKIGVPWTYSPQVTDPNGDPTTLRILEAPSGVMLSNGRVNWNPSALGLFRFVIEASDTRGGATQQSFTLEVVLEIPEPNESPMVTSHPTGPALIGSEWSYLVSAFDLENDPIQFQLASAPSGMSIVPDAPGRARITWTPASIPGNYSVHVWISDDGDGKHGTMHTFSLPVSQVNQSPMVRSIPYDARTGSTWTYHLDVVDPDQDSINFDWIVQQPGMTLDESGVIHWTPTLADQLRFVQGRTTDPIAKIRITDGHGGEVIEEVLAAVLPSVDDGEHAYIDNNITGPLYLDEVWSHLLKGIDPNGDSNKIVYQYVHLRHNGVPVPDGGAITVSALGMLTVDANSGSGFVLDDSRYEVIVKLIDEEQQERDYAIGIRFRSKNEWPRFQSVPTGELLVGETWSYVPQVTDPENAITFSLAPHSVGSLFANTVQFTPIANAEGKSFPLVILASDGSTDNNGVPIQIRQATTLVVTDHPPNFPRIASFPPVAIEYHEDALYSYTIQSPDSPLTYRISTGPDGMSVDAFGNVQWKPNAIGNYPVEIEVSNSSQQTTKQRFTVSSIRPYRLNEPPEITSWPTSPTSRDSQFVFPLLASDPNGDALEYSVSGPNWLSIHAATGVLSGIPSESGEFPVTVRVRESKANDNEELFTDQSFILTVLHNAPPRITSSIPPISNRFFIIGSSNFTYQVTAADPNVEDLNQLRFSLVDPPVGATIDSNSGLLSYSTSSALQRGVHTLVVQVSDSGGASDSQSFSVQALSTNNAAPDFISQLRTSLPEGLLYSLELRATDLDGDDVVFSLEPLQSNGSTVPPPSAMRLENGSVIVWTPPKLPNHISESVVLVGIKAQSVRDGLETIQRNTVTITKTLRNSPPAMATEPQPFPAATVGELYEYRPSVSDLDQDAVFWRLTQSPSAMRIDSRTGELRWTPGVLELGKHDVTIVASDAYGGSDQRTFTVTVRAGNLAPAITSTPIEFAPIGQAYQYQVVANDLDQPISQIEYALVGPLVGMNISSGGLFTWNVPTSLIHGSQYSAMIRASDTRGGVAEQVIHLTVYDPTINSPPIITESLPDFWIIGDTHPKHVNASDSTLLRNELFFDLIGAPQGMQLNPSSREVSWNIEENQIGYHTVSLAVFDGELYSRDTRRIWVRKNAPPSFGNIGQHSFVGGQSFQFDAMAEDADGDSITYSIVQSSGGPLPVGMTMHPKTGALHWATPTVNQLTTYAFEVLANDGYGGIGTQSFVIRLNEDTQPPAVSFASMPGVLEPGRDASVVVSASDNVAVQPNSKSLRFTGYSADASAWQARDSLVELDTLGRGTINTNNLLGPGQESPIGFYRFEATARDLTGNTGYAGDNGIIIVSVVADSSPPVIVIKSPSYNQSIFEPIDVFGTIDDPSDELAEYWVTIEPADRPSQRLEIKRVAGTAEIKDGVIASIDSTVFDNGQWTIGVFAKDVVGNIASSNISVVFEGNYKPGVLSLSFTDLDLATPDVPLRIQRSYSSNRSNKSLDFGYGWALDFGIPKIEIAYGTNASMGTSGLPVLVDGTRVNVRLPDGTVEGFTFQPYPKDPNLLGISVSWIPYFIPDKGNFTLLEVDQTPVYRIANGETWEYVSFVGAESYHPASRIFGGYWKLTLQSGTTMNVDARRENFAWFEDRNGNRSTVTPTSIEHWSGRNIAIARDASHENRITSITDSLGASVAYGYSPNGNLISVTDRSNQTTSMAYHAPEMSVPGREHLLHSIVDPSGRQQMMVTYRNDRRVDSIQDADHVTTSYAYDIRSRSQSITNGGVGTNILTQIITDRRGSPVKVIDPTNVTQINRFDNDGNLLQQRQVVGATDAATGIGDDLVTSYRYNEFGQPVAVIDTRGSTTQYVYENQSHQIATVISGLGWSTQYTYDSHGNLTRSIQPLGDQTRLTYLARGNLDTITDRNNTKVLDNEYDLAGNLIRTTGADGHSIRFEYDANGRRTAQIVEQSKDGRPFEIRSESTFDASDRIVATRLIHRTLLVSGQWQSVVIRSTQTKIDEATGRVLWEIDQRGLRTDYFYDRRGNTVQIIREVEVRNPNTSGEFDVSKARVSQWTVYDERGRVILTTDSIAVPSSDLFVSPPAQANRITYDVAGRVIRTERLLDVVVRTLDSNQMSPNLQDYSNYHDLRSELVDSGTTISSTLTQYDSAGRITRSRNSDGLWTQTFYGFAGEIVQTRIQSKNESGDLVWTVSRTAFDAQGRPILSTDASLENAASALATRTFYDDLGRAFQSERRFGVQLNLLDRFGAVVRHVDSALGPFSIRIENQGVDESGNINLISRSTQTFNDRGELIRTVSGIGPGHSGVETLFQYDARGRQYRQIGTPIATVDNLENLRLVTETEFDDQGRAFRTWTNIRGRDSGNEVIIDRQFGLATTQVFDHMGRVFKTIYSDSSSTNVEFDAIGQIVGETDTLGNTKRNTYDANGRLISIQPPGVPDPFDSDNDGITHSDTPTFEYAYDWAGNQIYMRDSNGHVTTHSYDQQGRLVRRTLPSGLFELFTYNSFGQQATHTSFEGVTTQSIYDLGNTIVPENDPTFRAGTGRLMEQRYFPPNTFNNGMGNPSEVWRFKYDAFGRKVETAIFKNDQGSLILHRTEQSFYNDRGQLIQESKPEGNINYAYDVVTGQRTRMWTTKSMGLTGANLADAIEDTRYVYNELGWLIAVEVVEKNDRILSSSAKEKTRYEYDLMGRPVRSDLANGVIEKSQVNRLGFVERIEHLRSDTTPYDLGDNPRLAEFVYRMDSAGNRTKLEERFWFDSDHNEDTPRQAKKTTYTWVYDDNERLISESIDSEDDNLDRTVLWEMDLFGNRRRETTDFHSRSAAIDEAITYLYDANDRLLSEQRDRDGNGTIDESTTYTWNGTQQSSKSVVVASDSTTVQNLEYYLTGGLAAITNRVRNADGNETSRTRVQYRYDSMGLRISATDYDPAAADSWNERSTTEYLFDSHNPTGYSQSILEVTKSAAGVPTTRKSFTFGRDEISQTRYVVDTSGGWDLGNTLGFGHDAHGSVREVFDSSSDIAQVYAFAAYGALLSIQNTHGMLIQSPLTTMLYNGESFDSRTGQLYLRARWYDGKRFTTLDPVAGSETSPLSFNKYNFVHSNPITGTDPSGRILLAIDGTGQRSWLTDRRNPHTLPNGRWLSHVRNFADDYTKFYGSRKVFYNFGPSEEMWASDLPSIETEAIQFVERLWRNDPSSQNEPIDIIGWSRGAYAALRLAQKIRGNMMGANGQFVRDTPVRFLGLYDPVDMTFYDEGGGITDIARNVKFAISVFGEEIPGRNDVDYDGLNPAYDWPRMSSISAWSTTAFTRLPMNASHGAIGGTPGYSQTTGRGYSYSHDRMKAMEADQRIREVAIKAGVNIELVNDYGFPMTQESLPRPIPRTWGEFRADWGKSISQLFAPIFIGGW